MIAAYQYPLTRSARAAASTSFPKLRTYRSDREIEFVAPPMNDRVAIEITDEFDDALLQLVCRVDTDVAEYGARRLGEKTLNEVEPGTVFGGEHKGEAAVRLSGQPGLGLPRDMRRVIVQNDLDRRRGWVGRVENFEELDELATAMAIRDERVHSTGKQIDAGH